MVGLTRLGIPLIEGAEVEELAAVCTQVDRHPYLLAVASPRLRGATGVPVKPLTIL